MGGDREPPGPDHREQGSVRRVEERGPRRWGAARGAPTESAVWLSVSSERRETAGRSHELHAAVGRRERLAVGRPAVDDDLVAGVGQPRADLLDAGLEPAVPGGHPPCPDHRYAHRSSKMSFVVCSRDMVTTPGIGMSSADLAHQIPDPVRCHRHDRTCRRHGLPDVHALRDLSGRKRWFMTTSSGLAGSSSRPPVHR